MFFGSFLVPATYAIYEAFELHKTLAPEVTVNIRWIFTLVFIALLTYFIITKHWIAMGLMTNVFINFVLFGEIIANLEYASLWVLPPPIVLYIFI